MTSPDYSSFLVNTPPVPQPHQQQRSGSNSSSSGSSSASRPSSSHQQHQQQQQQQQQQSYYDPSSSSSSNTNAYAGYTPSGGMYGGQRGGGSSMAGFPSSTSSTSPPNQQQPFASFTAASAGGGGAPQDREGSRSAGGGSVASLGWNPDEVFGGGDLQFQLPSFLGPSSHAAPGGGVETFPNRSVGDWNNPSFNAGGGGSGGDLMSGNGSGGTGGPWDAWNDSSLNFNSPPLKSYPAAAAAAIAPISANVPSPATILNQHQHHQPPRERSYPSPSSSSPAATSANPHNFHLPAQPTEAAAFPTRSHLLPSGPTLATIPQVGKSMPGLYSTTGFDVLGVLSRVVGRANPRTVLGPVDFSCSFLVVDIRKFDCPIVYASPTFSNLTGYEGKDIVGKNCRFLQSPDGEVTKGSRRRYTDNVAVSHLQRQLSQGKECQASLINYRKGGVPFINLVTVIPIPWDTEEIVFHVGFQVDLVESPNAILRNIRDGTYQVNYASLNNPQLPLAPAGQIEYAAAIGNKTKSGLTPELLDVLGSRANEVVGEEALQTEWYKTIFDQSDDFIHVLSLKGQFLYVSPSVRRVLEYEPEDLANKNIQDISHPSDHVPVMRALKDSTLKEGGAESSAVPIVNFLFRARRKTSGMVWIECTGRLHVEPGKGRKAVILCGRERVVPRLEWAAVARLGGIEEKDLWCSVSFDGLILSASSSVLEALAVDKEDVVGSSLLDFVPSSEATPPPVVLTSSSNTSMAALIEPPHARIQTALRSACQGLPKKSGSPVRHHVVVPASGGKPAMVHDVVTVFYSVDNSPSSSSSSSRGWEAGGSTSPWGPGSMMSGGEISPAASDATDSYSVEGGVGPSKRSVRATSVICQIKILSSTPKSSSSPPAWTASATSSSSPTSTSPRPIPTAPARPLTRPGATDVFEEVDKLRGTGWQYELHQLKNDNRKLREQIAAAREAGASSSRRLSGSYEPGRGKAIPKRKRDVVAPAPAPSSLPIAGPGPSSSAFALAPLPPPHSAYSTAIRDPLPAPLIAAPPPPPSASSYHHLASYPYQAPQQQQQHYYQPQPQPPQQQQFGQPPQQQQAYFPPQNFGSFAGGGGGAMGSGGQPSYAEYSNWAAAQARGKGGQQ